MLYLLDANIYIQAQGSYYDMDFCSCFWAFLDQSVIENRLVSIKEIQDELKQAKPAKAKPGEKQKEEDKLSVWVKARDHHFQDTSDDQTQNCFIQIVDYLMSQPHLNVASRDSFLNCADPWIIAKAMALSSQGVEVCIVTHEKRVPDNSTKVKVPNVCDNFDIAHTDCFTLLRTLKPQFRLAV